MLAAERQAAAFVLGLPVNMDGTEGPRAQSTRAFARNLARLTQLPIALWDERLSTAAVERELIAANVTRARRAKVIDQHAAVFILQGALRPAGARRDVALISATLRTGEPPPRVNSGGGSAASGPVRCLWSSSGSARAGSDSSGYRWVPVATDPCTSRAFRWCHSPPDSPSGEA